MTKSTVHKLAFNLAEASAMLGISKQTLMRLIARGKLKRVQHIGRIIIAGVEIQRFLTEGA